MPTGRETSLPQPNALDAPKVRRGHQRGGQHGHHARRDQPAGGRAGLAAGERQPVVIQREINYPVHTSVIDMNGDARQDVVIASLGDMNPSNHQKGSVALLIANTSGSFDHHVVLESVGRVADARAADFDAISSTGLQSPARGRSCSITAMQGEIDIDLTFLCSPKITTKILAR